MGGPRHGTCRRSRGDRKDWRMSTLQHALDPGKTAHADADRDVPTGGSLETHDAGPTGVTLPTPPSDDALYAYLGPQGRWLVVLMNVAAFVTLVTLTLFALRSWMFYPLFLILALSFLSTIFATITSVQPRRVSASSHRRVVSQYHPEVWPSVDVFLPTCGESMDVLANTYRYVSQMEWPGDIRPFVLDDADRSEVRELAESFGFRYAVRPNRGHMKKAGNLAYGYSVTSADLIVIFDADFCPRADFLFHLVPYSAPSKVGIVQSPQVFDSSARMNWLERGAGASQELFYRFIQPSRDATGAAICVGTSALYKREALEQNEGFARIDHSEDIYTGLELAARGYELRYVPIQLSKGLSPDSVRSFINQQYRWCLGAISLMLSPEFHRIGMTPLQRMAHWAGFLFYITTAIGVIFVELPGLFALLFFASSIEPWYYVGLLPALWVKMVVVPMAYRSSIRFEVQRVEMLFGFAHLFAVIDGLRGKAAAWVPTSSEATVSAQRGGGIPLPQRAAIAGVVVNTLLVGGLAYAVTRGMLEYGAWSLWMPVLIVGVFAYTAVPVAWAMLPVAIPNLAALRPFRSVGGARRRSSRFGSELDHSMAWPEATAITSIIVCVGTAALIYS